MVKNNHFKDNRRELDLLLRTGETADGHSEALRHAMEYADCLAQLENALVVVSDMTLGESRIVAGSFARQLDLADYRQENSIWESRILELMTAEEREEKYLAELRFFHFLRHLPKSRRPEYYLVTKLRFRYADGSIHDVLHRMYYIYDKNGDAVSFAICIYGPLSFDFSGKSRVVNSVTGLSEDLTTAGNEAILSRRERQVLTLIEQGLKSKEIAERLHISVNTVSRHRQEILARLQVANSHEACRLAKSLRLI